MEVTTNENTAGGHMILEVVGLIGNSLPRLYRELVALDCFLHYKREHCWGHMILEVAGLAHMISLFAALMFTYEYLIYRLQWFKTYIIKMVTVMISSEEIWHPQLKARDKDVDTSEESIFLIWIRITIDNMKR